MGSALGVRKATATKLGLTLEQYMENINNGLKYCWKCKKWKRLPEFNTDKSRGDNLSSLCKSCKPTRHTKLKQPIEQIRAHRMIQMRVVRGTIPHPSSISCVDCGHIGGDKRHEYHHENGYIGKHKDDIVALCTTCHNERHRN